MMLLQALLRVLQRPSGFFSLGIIVTVTFLGLLGPLFFPQARDGVPYSQQQNPGFQNASPRWHTPLVVIPDDVPVREPLTWSEPERSRVPHTFSSLGEPTGEAVTLAWPLCLNCTHVQIYRNEVTSKFVEKSLISEVALHPGARGIPLAILPRTQLSYTDQLALEGHKSYLYTLVPMTFAPNVSAGSDGAEGSEDVSGIATLRVDLSPSIPLSQARYLVEKNQAESIKIGQKIPGPRFLFGTDALGRDVFARVLEGTRVALAIAFTAPLICLIIGLFVGATAALAGGWVDLLLMRLIEICDAIPELLVLILLQLVLGQGVVSVIVTLSLFSWLSFARLVRGEVLRLRGLDFVQAAQLLGAGRWRLIVRHVAPNLVSSIVVVWSNMIPRFIAAESFLSFIGLGIEAPQASWGNVLLDAGERLQISPLGFLLPAGFVGLTLLSFFVVGDLLRDAFDPRLGRSLGS